MINEKHKYRVRIDGELRHTCTTYRADIRWLKKNLKAKNVEGIVYKTDELPQDGIRVELN